MIADTIVFKLQADVADLQSKFAQASGSVQTLSKSASAGSGNVLVFRRALNSLAIELSGVNPAVGHLAEGMAVFGAGSALAIGVVAGIGLIAGAYKLATSTAKDLQKANEDATTSFEAAMSAGRSNVAGWLAVRKAMEDLDKAQATLDRLQQSRQWGFHPFKWGPLLPATGAEITAAQQVVATRTNALQGFTDNWHKAQDAVVHGGEKGQAAIDKLALAINQAYRETLGLFAVWRDNQATLQALGALPPGAGISTVPMLRGGPPHTMPVHSYLEIAAESDRIRNGPMSEMEKNLKEAGAQIGAAFITSMAGGMKNMGGFLKQVALQIADIWLVGVFKKVLGIASPSIVGQDMGMNFDLGLAQGLMAGRGMVGAAAGNTAMKLAGSAAISLNVSGMPSAGNPLAMARDGDWQRFLRESNLVARGDGFKFA